MKTSEADLGPIWTALPIAAFLLTRINAQEAVSACNAPAELFTRASSAQLIGMPLFEWLQSDVALDEAGLRARESGSPVFFNDVSLTIRDSAPITCNLQFAPMGEGDPHLLLLLTPRDIAGRLGRTQVVKAAAKSAVGMADMLAHEIKNPLAGITGAAQLLSMNLSPEDRELTDLIVEESRRVVKLLEQVEQFGDQRPPERRALNIHDVLERARRSAEVGFGAHMKISDDYDPSLPEVWGDPDQLQQVFLNLLKNAAEAQPRGLTGGGAIRIRTWFEKGLHVKGHAGERVALPLHIEITDDGPGLPEALADSMFDPFVSGRENGTGLGLALVSKIIGAHEGWIELTSRPGETRVRISLPREPQPDPKQSDTSQPDTQPSALRRTTRPKT